MYVYGGYGSGLGYRQDLYRFDFGKCVFCIETYFPQTTAHGTKLKIQVLHLQEEKRAQVISFHYNISDIR